MGVSHRRTGWRGCTPAVRPVATGLASDITGTSQSLQKRLAKDEGIPPNDLRARVLGSEQGLLDKSMRRAAARHEIDPSPLTQRRKSVVIDVLRHELLMAQSPNADAVIYRGRRDQDNQRPVVPASVTSDPAAKTSA